MYLHRQRFQTRLRGRPSQAKMPDLDERVGKLEVDMAMAQTEIRIQNKELFMRVKRLEAVLLAAQSATIIMLLTILTRMG